MPIDAIEAIEEFAPVRPCGAALHTAQQRAREKQFLADRGFPTAPFARAASLDELWDAVARIGTPSVIKTAAFGYDGKGQHKVTTPADVEHVWTAIGHQEAVVEKFISLQTEISVIGVRGPTSIVGGSSASPAVRPVGGCSATYGVAAITRVTCSTSSPVRIESREVVP